MLATKDGRTVKDVVADIKELAKDAGTRIAGKVKNDKFQRNIIAGGSVVVIVSLIIAMSLLAHNHGNAQQVMRQDLLDQKSKIGVLQSEKERLHGVIEGRDARVAALTQQVRSAAGELSRVRATGYVGEVIAEARLLPEAERRAVLGELNRILTELKYGDEISPHNISSQLQALWVLTSDQFALSESDNVRDFQRNLLHVMQSIRAGHSLGF